MQDIRRGEILQWWSGLLLSMAAIHHNPWILLKKYKVYNGYIKFQLELIYSGNKKRRAENDSPFSM